jgi:acetolactate synthase-1/2/3 large subunit
MNGAESLVRTLLDEQVDLCFTNPGASEMHFVAALDRVPGMRCVPVGIARHERNAPHPEGAMSIEGIGRVVAALMPEHAIVVDESVSSGRGFGAPTAAPDRQVLALEGDGSAMYTVQSLWTMAREGLDTIDWVGLARSLGVEAGRATDLGELARELSRGFSSRGPYLVEAVL